MPIFSDTDIHPVSDAAYDLVVAVADGRLRDVDAIATHLADWQR
jgi:hypothetical protein